MEAAERMTVAVFVFVFVSFVESFVCFRLCFRSVKLLFMCSLCAEESVSKASQMTVKMKKIKIKKMMIKKKKKEKIRSDSQHR